MISKEANINQRNGRGETPLHIAAENKNEKMVALLINAGSNLYIGDQSGVMPIHRAVHSQSLECVKLFFNADLQQRASRLISKKEENDENENKQVEHDDSDNDDDHEDDPLIKYRSILFVKDSNDVTPLHISCMRGNLEITKFIIDKGQSFVFVFVFCICVCILCLYLCLLFIVYCLLFIVYLLLLLFFVFLKK